VPTKLASISLFPRDDAEWWMETSQEETARPDIVAGVSAVAQDIRRLLAERGACFFADLVRMSRHLPTEVENGLWELAAAGVVTADGFDNLRALMDPRRRRAEGRERSRRPRHAPGRWSLLRHPQPKSSFATREEPFAGRPAARSEEVARQLLRRYGIVFRDLLMRESLVPAWRDLLVTYRRMELKGEVRGGRFVEGFTGEQFALPEAVEALRAGRMTGSQTASAEVRLSACDPLNLAGVILPGPRVPALPTNFLIIRDGTVVRTILGRERAVELVPDFKEAGQRV
jgi:ATP-dependent Lhr-like helicase